MFHFSKSCEISFQVSGTEEEKKCSKNVGTDSELLEAIDLYMTSKDQPVIATKLAKPPTGHKRKSHVRESAWGTKSYQVARGGGGSGLGGEDDTKKIMHRDSERQRRVVMAGLLHTLSSLLPPDFVKGKRSVSDHIAETVNYINHLQKNTKELADKRDRLRTMQANSAESLPFEEDSSLSSIPRNVAIYTSNGGLEIQISGGNREDGFRLSKALKVLLDEGLSVICSVSSKVNAIFIHNIQCQINVNIDLQWLQHRLYDVVCSNNSTSSMYAAGTDRYSPFELMEKENQIYSSFLIM